MFQKSQNFFVLWILLLSAFISFDSLAQTTGDYRTNGVGTNWGTALNWDRWSGVAWVPGVSFPGQAAAPVGTTVTIQSGHNMVGNLTPANSINTLIFAANAANSSLTMSAGFTLTITGAVTFNNPIPNDTRSQTLAAGAGNIICGSITMFNTTGTARTNVVSIAAGGSLTVNGAITTPGLATENLITLAGTATLNIVGPFANASGGLTLSATSTVRWFGDNTNFRSDVNYGNLTIEIPVGATGSRIKSLANNLTVQGVFTAQSLHATNTVSLDPVGNNFTVNGATNLNARGIFTDTNAGGINTFTGTVTLAAASTFSTATVTALTNLLFGNGISNAGTFTAGGATFNTTGGQSVGGASAMSFANPVSIGVDITLAGAGTLSFANSVTLSTATTDVTNNKTNPVTFSNTGAAMLTGTAGASWIQGAGSTLSYAGSTITNITLNASTNLNTVNYTAASQTLSPVAYSTLGLTGSGTVTMTGITTIDNFNINGTVAATAAADLTIGNFTLTAGTFVAGAFTHDITGNWTKNGGTFTNTNSTINFIGGTQIVGGANPTLFNNLTIANGTEINLGGLTTHTANTLKFGGRGESAGTWGGTGSGATNITTNYFTPASGRITIAVTGSANIHYQEDFGASANGATTSSPPLPPWSVTQFPSSGTFSKQSPFIFFGAEGFEINNTGATEGVWETADLDISAASGFTEVYINLDVYAIGIVNAADYVDVSYVWDAEGPASENPIQTVTTTTASPSIFLPIGGHKKIRLVIRAKESTPGGALFGIIPYEYILANVNILGIRNLYSRANAAWASSGTWSTVGIGGVDCVCTPSALGTDRIFIGGNTVTFTANGTAASVAIHGTADTGGAGTLLWTNNFDLNTPLEGSTITVNNGGQINGGGFANARITFTEDATQSIINNGTISVGDILITGSLFDAPTISLSGSGSTTLTDALSITGATAGGATVNAVFTNSSSGAFTVTGITTLNDATYTDSNNASIAIFGGNVSLAGNSVFSSTAVTSTGNLIFRGGINHGGATFNAGGATFNTNNQTLNGAGTMSFANIVTVTAPTAVTSDAIVTMSNTAAGTLTGDGAWNQRVGTLNYAGATLTVTTFNANSGGNTVNYNSNIAQAIRSPIVYDILTLNNSSGAIPSFTVAGNTNVTSTLNLTSGIVNLAGFTFTLGISGGASDLNRVAGTTNNWFYGGPFRRFWPITQTPSPTAAELYGLFPLGHSIANSYRPVGITGSTNITTTGSVTFQHLDATGYVDLNPVYDDDPTVGVTNIVRKLNSQHIGSMSGVVGGGTNMILSIAMTGLNTGVASEIRTAVSNGATTVTNAGTHVGNLGTATNPIINRNGLTVANLVGDFRITTINSVTTPLPIELISFNGEVVENKVRLNWETASELNNDFFTVERSAGGEVFSSIGKVNGAGTTSQGATYSLIDHNPIYGTGYYRLKQTDFDGTFTYSKIVAITFEGSSIPVMDVYPNPSGGDDFKIIISGLKDIASVPVVMYDQLGRECMRLTLIVDENSGTASKAFSLEKALPQGMYLLKAGASQTLTKRFIVGTK